MSGYVNTVSGLYPELVVREGKTREAVMELLKEDPDIKIKIGRAHV